jgi:replicative superfamily II helicase
MPTITIEYGEGVNVYDAIRDRLYELAYQDEHHAPEEIASALSEQVRKAADQVHMASCIIKDYFEQNEY